MKIKIIKPFKTSGYFINDEVEVNELLLEKIKAHNDIEILEDKIIQPQSTRGRKKGSTKK